MRPSRTAGMISWNGMTTISPTPPGTFCAAQRRNSKYAVERSLGTATRRPLSWAGSASCLSLGCSQHKRSAASAQGAAAGQQSVVLQHPRQCCVGDLSTSGPLPSAASVFVMSMSAYRTSSSGAPGIKPMRPSMENKSIVRTR